MNSGRMKKLAGINEGTAFKNGKFTLDRFDVWTTSFGDIADELSPDGEWCAADDVAKLEAIANKMYDILNELDQAFARDRDPGVIYAIVKDARSVIKKAKSL